MPVPAAPQGHEGTAGGVRGTNGDVPGTAPDTLPPMDAALSPAPSAPWRWRRTAETGVWLAALTLNTVFNGMVASTDNLGRLHPATPAEPWV